MDIDKKMGEIISILKGISNYDVDGFVNQLYYWVKELEFFYNNVVPKQGGDPARAFYKVKPSQRPKEGQVAYFNLRRGYPKETYDGHYCYILKDYGFKYLVIPTTSVKEDSSSMDERFEIDIKLKGFENDRYTRLHIDDMRVVDIQRLNEKKKIYELQEDINKVSEVNEKIKKLLF
ncbi:MAG: hypothetical protein PWR27_682 [Petroclostridium sp.]|jgi:hypothetical protein|uniref:hypothetical protein n=1 Tax=Petroclostridium xylanilyticum TaxID=1792311 RepID=UPI000B9869B4|nr:hypothetical protein [Petroclostridium xylanilyticum]MDK2809973.1 hypothetical protein [Petroclostridium sp.]